jgi:hypothetical protein
MLIKTFIRKHRVTMSYDWTEANPSMSDPEWSRTANHFKVAIRAWENGHHRQYTTYYSMCPGLDPDPQLDDVLSCLASDAAGIENARSFEEWASEYGFDEDSRKAEKIFKACQKSAARLRRLLGNEAYNELLWEVDPV